MHPDVWLVFLHLLCIIGTASMLVAEMMLCRPGIAGAALHRLKRIDIAYAVFAVAALATGATLLFHGAKGSAYYLANPVFHAKFGLFVLIALISIVPTVRFIGWSKAAQRQPSFAPEAAAVAGMRRLLHVELVLLAWLPLLGAAMARGVTRFAQLLG